MGTSDSSLLKAHFDGLHPVETTQSHAYVIQRAKPKLTEHSRKNSVLIFSGDKHLMENLKHFSRTIKHPSLLYYTEAYSVDSSLTTHIVFENAIPLVQCLKDMTAQELVHGMHNVTNALMFIHDKCLCSYNNVLMSSIFVADSGEWKLGCLENMSKFTNSSWQVFAQNKIPSHLLPPEDSCEAAVPAAFGYTRDIYMLGHLFKNDILNVNNYSRHNTLSLNSSLTDFVSYTTRHMLNQDYKLRPKCVHILKQPVFNSYYSLIVNFFHNFLTKSEEEKTQFLQTLREKITTLDSKLVVARILPLLLDDWVIYETTAQRVIADILNPAVSIRSPKSERGFLSESLYKEHVVPQFLKLLQSRSIDTRLLLLSQLKPILPYIPKKEISKLLLPKLLAGLRDTNDDIVSLTFHCLGDLVPYLGSNRVVGGSRRVVFVETRPRSQSVSSISNVDSSYCAEDEENESDSDIESSSEVSLSSFHDSQSRISAGREARKGKQGFKRYNNAEDNPKPIIKSYPKPIKKPLSELADKLDPISEKTEDFTPKSILKTSASKQREEKGSNTALVQKTDDTSNLDTLSESELKIIQKFTATGNISGSPDGSNRHHKKASPQNFDANIGLSQSIEPEMFPEYAGKFNRVKPSLSDENEPSSDEVVSSYENERYLEQSSMRSGGDSSSTGSLRENRLSFTDGNQMINRKTQQFGSELENSKTTDLEFGAERQAGVNEDTPRSVEASGENGWDDLDWNSD